MTYTTHRPELHVTAEQGVLNAPAGAIRDADIWHVFLQYQPSQGAPARWAHQTLDVTNPYDWDICDDVLAPEGDEIQVRAGSVVAVGDTGSVDLFFTSVTPEGTEVHVASVPALAETVTDLDDNALTLDSSVSRVGRVLGDHDGWRNFRSPCVLTDGPGRWLMLAVTGDIEEPRLVILDSTDLRTWTVRGPMSFEGDPGVSGGHCMVSPRLLRLRDEVDGELHDVLLTTIEQDGGPDISGYLVGSLNGSRFTVRTPFTRMDFGHDFTRPRNTNFTGTGTGEKHSDSALVFGLMNGVGRKDDPGRHKSLTDEKWANCLSMPRLVTLQGGRLFQTPTPGLPRVIPGTTAARMITTMLEVGEGSVSIDVLDGDGEPAVTVSHHGDRVDLDRSMNPVHRGDAVASGPLADADTDSLTVIVDGSTVEVFVDGGVAALASRVYFTGGCGGFTVRTDGDARVLRTMDLSPLPHDSTGLGEVEDGFDPDSIRQH
ncbi:GH32 C-terminal domain-containing protein [Corynebacterium pygosceleis]|uniref:beta-fructofuranosidase n=1 Tax=Corynebacterium pygosceleis TaxID=2800406 RepID=A0A9Q4GIR9_9CORY|nr:GH32 C-terminal domain-containing protein [Corynebacterium pygosceleis]MCK7637977.1 GH32 C-terminal domain-containing protein [Corynebacterium pygosceleis]MCK7675692.1 GH32 C-terminal domain-containing protein [Corynebacterium pygosceleis]MCX7468693.1 GH32 C-terminal domain-containing protein [Corynebacterium pygosceleis]